MWFSSKRPWGWIAGAACLTAGCLFLGGCMASPHQGDQPWTETAPWEGTIPLPSGFSPD
jgi:hypothetical protein